MHDQARIAQRRLKIAEMMAKGITNRYELARRLGYDEDHLEAGRNLVWHDIRVIKKAWLKARYKDRSKWTAQQVAKLGYVEREYWKGWEESRGSFDTSALEEKLAEAPQDLADAIRLELFRLKGPGDPRFLDGVLKCIERRCGLFGLDEPAPTPPEENFMGLTPAEEALMLEIHEQRIRRIEEVPGSVQELPNGRPPEKNGSAGKSS